DLHPCIHTLSPSSPTPSGTYTFFFNGTAPTDIYTLSLHDALPILLNGPIVTHRHEIDRHQAPDAVLRITEKVFGDLEFLRRKQRSEEYTSELQSRGHLVCRLLLEKKKYAVRR